MVLTVRVLWEVEYATATRVERHGMGAAATIVAAAEGGQAAPGRSADHRRHRVEAGDRCPLARRAGAVRALADGVHPVPALDAGRGLGPDLRGRPAAGRRGRPA